MIRKTSLSLCIQRKNLSSSKSPRTNMQIFQIILVCALGISHCKGQNSNQHSNQHHQHPNQQAHPEGISNPELILYSVLHPKKGLFRAPIFDEARRLCPSSNDELKHCDNVRYHQNETLIHHLCSKVETDDGTEAYPWELCGDPVSRDAENCFAKNNDPRKVIFAKENNIWRFTLGFSKYFCQDHKFTETLMEKSEGTLVCSNKNINNQISDCVKEQGKINPKQRDTTGSDDELCRSYDVVQFCINEIYRAQCVASHPKVTEMLAGVKTEIECQNFKGPKRTYKGTESKKRTGKNTGTAVRVQIIFFAPIILAVLTQFSN